MSRKLLVAGAVVVISAAVHANTQPGASRPSPPIRTLTEQEVVDLLVGSAIQATRAQDSEGLIKRAKELMAQGKKFQLVAVEDLPDDWIIVAAAGGLGGGGAWEHVRERMEQQKVPTLAGHEGTLRAMDALSKHVGKKFDAVIRNEAAGATFNAFQSAIAKGIPVVDGCPAGRAKPEIQQSVAFINGLTATPAALVSRWGDVVIVDKAIDDYRFEDIGRSFAVGSGGSASQVRNVMTGAQAKRGLIADNLSQAILYGRTVRQAVKRGEDPIAALVKVARGFKLFQGVVTKAEFKGERGHSYWDVEMKGSGPYAGNLYKVWVKNENIIAWLDGKLDVAPPDFIYNLDPKTGRAISGVSLGGYAVGGEVAMVGVPAQAPWRTPKGIELIGPRHFGYDLEYVPIEELQKKRPKFGTE